MTLPIKKIYINSNFKTPDSQSDSNFKFQLTRSIHLPKNTIFYIENFTCSHAWYSVEEGLNDKLCIKINEYNYVLQIPPGNYTGPTFIIALQTVLNEIAPNIFTVTFNTKQNNLNISIVGSNTFRLYTNVETLAIWNTTQTVNKILQNEEGTSKLFNSSNSYTSGFLELLSIRNIYLHSPNLSSFSTYGGKGESNIIKKIPVSSDFGYLIIENFTSTHDWLDCSNLTLSCLEFVLRDSYGNIVPLHGSSVSFSIVFSKQNLEDV